MPKTKVAFKQDEALVLNTDLQGRIISYNSIADVLANVININLLNLDFFDGFIANCFFITKEQLNDIRKKFHGNDFPVNFSLQCIPLCSPQMNISFSAYKIFGKDKETIIITGNIKEKEKIYNENDTSLFRWLNTELSRKNDLLKLVFDLSDDALWKVDLKTKQAFFSKKFYTLFGYNISGHTHLHEIWFKLFNPEEKDYVNINYCECIKTKNTYFEDELRIKTKQNKWLWCNVKGKILTYDHKGKPQKIAGIVSDITEKENTVLMANEQKNIYELMLSVAKDMSVFKDENFKYKAVNPALLNFLGMQMNDVINKTDFDIFPHHIAQYIRDFDVEVRNSGKSATILITPQILLKLLKQDSPMHEKYFQAVIIPVKDKFGNVKGTLFTARDITELKHKELAIEKARHKLEEKVLFRTKELRAKNAELKKEIEKRKLSEKTVLEYAELLNSIINNAPVGIFIKDLQKRYYILNKFSKNFFKINRNKDLVPIIHNTVNNELINKIAKADEKIFNNKKIIEKHIQYKTQQEIKHFYLRQFPLFDENNKLYSVCGIFTDFTDIKKAEKELIKSKERWKALFDNNSDLVLIHYPGKTFIDVNHTACHRLGYSYEKMLTLKPEDLLVETGKKYQNIKKRIKKEKRVIFETEIRTAKGYVFSVEANINLFQQNSQKIVISMLRDITSRKILNKIIMKSEKKYRLLFNNARDLIFVQNKRGNFIDANKLACERLKYSRREMFGMNIKKISTMSEKKIKKLTDEIYTQGYIQIETEFISKNGDKFPVEASTYLYYIGEYPYFVTISRDITEHKQAARKIKTSEEKYRMLADNMIDMVSLHKPDGTYIYVNPAVENILGYSENELIQKNAYDFFHPDDIESISNKSHNLALQGKIIESFEYRIQKKSGEYIWFSTDTKPIFNEKNELIQLQAISRDITTRKQMENEIRIANERLARANRLKDEFIAYVSHELMNKIGLITMSADYLLSACGDKKAVNEEAMDKFKVILKTAETLELIIEDIIDISKIEADKINIESRTFSVKGLINQVVNSFSQRNDGREINIKKRVFVDKINADPKRVIQILSNFISNSIRYSKGEKTEIIISVKKTLKGIFFSVADYGMGIKKENIKKIFEPYFREDIKSHIKRSMGIGLNICKKLVDLMGGIIHVRSQQGKGSVFAFYLPHAYVDDN